MNRLCAIKPKYWNANDLVENLIWKQPFSAFIEHDKGFSAIFGLDSLCRPFGEIYNCPFNSNWKESFLPYSKR